MPPVQTIMARDTDELAARAADIFKTAARTHIDRSGRFVAALSGGSTPRRMHRLLADPTASAELPWERIHLFWVDERCVAASDPESNLGNAWRDLLTHIPIPLGNIHFTRGDFPAEEAAAEYQMELIEFFQLAEGKLPVFDLIFLGVGVDGHTGSLFPDLSARRHESRLVLAVKGGIPDLWRITMTYSVLNQARQIVFLVTGKEKAAMVKALLDGTRPELPAARIKPLHGEVIWLLDQDAASLLQA